MPLSDYLVGLVFWAGTIGLALWAAWVVLSRRLPRLTGPARLAAGGILGMAAVTVVHLVPGILGVLSRGSVLAAAAVLALAAGRLRRRPAPEPETVTAETPSGAVSTALAAIAAGVLGLAYLTQAWGASAQPAGAIDPLTHHLPNVAAWVRSGSFWQIDQYVPLLANGNYPHTGDVLFLSAVLPWSNDAFVRPLNLVWVALLAVCVYALCRELGAPRSSSVLFTAVLGALPVTVLASSYGAMTDLPMLAALSAGVLFLVRHFRMEDRGDLLLAGLGLGLAFGTKWYAVSTVAVLVGLWAAVWLISRRPAGQLLRNGALLGGVIAAAGGFWMLRNLVLSGNPVFPQPVSPLGLTLFDAPFDPIRACTEFAIADYLGAPGILREYVLPAWWENYALGGLVLAIASGAALIAAVVVRRRAGGWPHGARTLLVGSAAVGLLAATYAVTPYTAFGLSDRPFLTGANTRYLLPALMLAASLAAAASTRLGRLRPVLELLAVAAVVDGLRRSFSEPAEQVVAVALGAGLVGLGIYAAVRLGPGTRRRGALPAAALLIVLLVALGHDRQREFNDGRYENIEATTDWIARNAPGGHRIGLAGVWGVNTLPPVLPAYGKRLGNHVEYLGPTVDGQLREYATRSRWASAVRAGGFDLLLVGRGGYGEECPVPGSETDDDAWARAEGFKEVARSNHLTLYRVPGVRIGAG